MEPYDTMEDDKRMFDIGGGIKKGELNIVVASKNTGRSLIKENKMKKLAVLIGRFQSDEMCSEMNTQILRLLNENDKVLILLGLSPVVATKQNPMDFETRKLMVDEYYGNFESLHIGYVKDNRSDDEWSKSIDEQVDRFAKKHKLKTISGIHGGKYTFCKHYNGKHKAVELSQKIYKNNETQNARAGSSVKGTKDFRDGVIWATQNQYPKVYPTVDVAVLDGENLLLARKPNETKFRFIGGFVDTNEKFEDAAKREVMEEANIEIQNLQYMGSFMIDDHRYRREVDSITTTFFVAEYVDGEPRAQDDIEEIRYIPLSEIDVDDLVPEHAELFETLLNDAYDENGNFIL